MIHTTHITHTPALSHTMSAGSGGGGGSGSGGRGSGGSGQLGIGSFLGRSDGDGDPSDQQPPAPAPVNAQARKLTFPADVPAAVKSAINRYTAPRGYSIAEITAASRTPISFWGVRLEKGDGPWESGVRKQKFACLADNKCRAGRNLLSITAAQTSGATTHLNIIPLYPG